MTELRISLSKLRSDWGSIDEAGGVVLKLHLVEEGFEAEITLEASVVELCECYRKPSKVVLHGKKYERNIKYESGDVFLDGVRIRLRLPVHEFLSELEKVLVEIFDMLGDIPDNIEGEYAVTQSVYMELTE